MERKGRKEAALSVALRAPSGAASERGRFSARRKAEVKISHRMRQGMFVAQVVGRSMEPRIPDGAWCLFQSPVEGSRQGRIILVEHRDIDDPETGGSYTVKRYKSKKEGDGTGTWRHTEIRLDPENPEFAPIVLRDVRDDELHVVAELVEVLKVGP